MHPYPNAIQSQALALLLVICPVPPFSPRRFLPQSPGPSNVPRRILPFCIHDYSIPDAGECNDAIPLIWTESLRLFVKSLKKNLIEKNFAMTESLKKKLPTFSCRNVSLKIAKT